MTKQIKELAELYAIGCISLTQVAEEVEKLPFSEQTKTMWEAMEIAEIYYDGYEKWMLTQQSLR